MDRQPRSKAPQRSVAQEGLGEAVLVVTVRDGQATEAIRKLRTALSDLSTLSTRETSSASSVGRAIETATNRATASVARLAETYKRVQTEQQATIRNARTFTQELLSRGVTPLTTTPAAQREQQTAAARNAAQDRRAQTRTSQTAGGSGLTRFLREQDQLAEAAARNNARAAIAERRAENRATQTAGGSGLLSFFRRQEQLQQELRDDAEVQLQRAAAQARRAESFEQRLTQSRQRSAQAAETAAAAENTRRRADLQGRISSGLIGGAFPLLFGQGPGAALGGLAGGVAGGGAFGFGASLVGTGIGASFDALIARSKELAEALRDPLASFDQLKAASVLSSRGLETYIEALIKTGQTAKAEQLIRADLTQNINPTTAAALSEANDELARSFSDVQEKLSALVAGPAIAFLKWLDEIIDRLPIQGPGGAAPGQLPSPAAARNTAQAGRQTQGIGLGLSGASLATFLAGIALFSTGVGAPAGTALLGYSLLGAGAATVGAGKFQEAQGNQAQDDLATQRATAGIQKEIEAIQARRVALQKQLVGFTGNESSAAAQIAQGQNVALAAQEAILTARKAFASIPFDASPKEAAAAWDAYKKAVAAARLEVDKLVAANNNQAANLKRTTDIRERTTGFSPAARQGAELAAAVTTAREGYDKAKAAYEKAVEKGTKLEIAVAASQVNSLGQAWRAAVQNVRDYNAAGDRLILTAQRNLDVTKRLSGLEGARLDIARTLAGVDEARNAYNDAASQGSTKEFIAAGIEFENKLRQASDYLTKAAKDAALNFTNAVLTLGKLEASPEGLNRFLTRGEQTESARRAILRVGGDDRTGPSQLESAITKATELLGLSRNQADERFQGLRNIVAEAKQGRSASQEGFNALSTFIEDVRAREQAVTGLSEAQSTLTESNASLVQVNNELLTQIQGLAQKEWTVQVTANVPIDAQSQLELNRASTL